MKDVLKGIGLVLVFIVLLLGFYAFTASGTLLVQKYIYPQWLSVQRSSVESSKSYVDSKNTALVNLSSEYIKLDTKIAESGDNQKLIDSYKAQQTAILGQMCQIISTMKRDTIASMNSQFISQNGGCN
jgi:hypothetical protein